MQKPETRCIKTRRTATSHMIELDPASWAELMVALGIAIDHSDSEWAARLRTLRTALSHADSVEC